MTGTSWAPCQWMGTESGGSQTMPHRNPLLVAWGAPVTLQNLSSLI